MVYVASVRDRETKKIEVITRDYPTKKEFRSDLAGNGYSIRFIATEEDFDEACYKYYEKLEIKKSIKKMRYQSDKKHAENLGMSVKEYRKWLKED